MKKRLQFMIACFILLSTVLFSACTQPAGPCTFTANVPTTAYRLPDATSDVFGMLPSGDEFEALARTADGWVGFDPGIAQAGNIGLAHHRWVQINLDLSASCLTSVDLVTLEDVLADLEGSGQ